VPLTDLETTLLEACKIALPQLTYDGDDKTAFAGAAYEALTKAIAKAETAKAMLTPPDDAAGQSSAVPRVPPVLDQDAHHQD
jgi:hypothetical protein